jgi:hypothetical protein
MVADCLRVARRGIFLTTPNRWFPVEFHTQLPLLHWLPNDAYRPIYRAIGLEFFCRQGDDLMNSARRHPDWRFAIRFGRLLGLNSNLILCAHRTLANP